jgi:hypothetical protein
MKRKNGTMFAMFLISLLVAAPAMAGPLEVLVGWLDLLCEPCNELRVRTASTDDEIMPDLDSSNLREPVADPMPIPPTTPTNESSSGE